MKNIVIAWFFCTTLFLSCNTAPNEGNIEKWTAEINAAENNFNDLAQKDGLSKAFQAYAAPDGAIRRSGEIIKGNQAITDWYRKETKPNETLTWKPEFVDVSAAGDLAYTYGSFVFTLVDSTGTANEYAGIYHTVWKRQADGTWKFVWD